MHLDYMCGSAASVVTGLYLQSETCINIVTIILMAGLNHTHYMYPSDHCDAKS